jgi:hypothetical protein
MVRCRPCPARGAGRPGGVRAGILDGLAGGTGRRGLLEELPADRVIAWALRDAPTGRLQCGQYVSACR